MAGVMARNAWLPTVLILVGLAMSLFQASLLLPDEAPAGSTTSAAQTPSVAPPTTRAPTRSAPSTLPPEAGAVLEAITRGGPYAYPQDDGVFQNREGRLPSRPRGHYREYTVETPGSHDRGARRIITGGQPPTEFFYTDDHYDSFRRFEPSTRELR